MIDHHSGIRRVETIESLSILSGSAFPAKLNLNSLDLKIISLMVTGLANKQISTRLKIPLSTVQRST